MNRNIFTLDGITGDASLPEHVDRLVSGVHGLWVERIVSCGQCTPEGTWYDQDHDEWVLVLEGEARLGFNDAPDILLHKGDFLLLPQHVKHRVLFTSNPCIWLAIHAQNLDA